MEAGENQKQVSTGSHTPLEISPTARNFHFPTAPTTACVLSKRKQRPKPNPKRTDHVLIKPDNCQRHIEMSSYLPDRNVLFTGQSGGVDGKVDSSARGRAQADAQGRGDDGAGSEESIGN
jgi:hypothetical protein